jgi:hypothetical protein
MGGAISWLLLSVLYLLVRVVRPEAGLSSLNDARYKVQVTTKQPLMLVSFFIKYTRFHTTLEYLHNNKNLVSSNSMEPSEHRVDRVLGLFSSSPNWDPHPPPASKCVPFWFQRGGGTLACGRWGVGSNSDDWRENMALCLLCGLVDIRRQVDVYEEI